uniref:Uncharacterized protein n=1 Tax=Ananas comosus var. bracteatus TaxID=296719 RepID=A0A6V7QPU7_ANACO|nr:unnamed protein product [Ananas comosus var. bracteatus]
MGAPPPPPRGHRHLLRPLQPQERRRRQGPRRRGKHDAAQSYVPQILRGPSAVFGDDDDGVDGDDDRGDAGVRAWSSQYYPNDPVVVVAKDSGSAGSGRGRGRGGDEPLLLPVRSLKSRAREADSGRNRFSRTPDEDAAVLSSPIPWRSRSGRFESKEESGPLNRTSSFRSPGVRSTSATSTSPSSASPKRGFYKSTPPPAPPPPPPPFVGHLYSPASDRKITTKSFKDELKDVSAKPLMKPQSSINIPSSIAKSVRTVRPKEAQATQAADGPEIPVPVPMYRRKEDSEFVDKAVIESDDSDSRDSDSSDERETDDDDIIAESSGKEDEAPNCVAEAKAEAEPDDNEVDKKADEFIAKFREQIRLQRIESIKRSTRRRSDKHPK